MRDVLNLKPVNLDSGDYTVISFDTLPEYNTQDYDLNIPKEYEKFILDVKKECRGSFEYSHYMAFLKENLDMNKCSFFENVTGQNSRRIHIEIHHDPFTIEDIIRIIVKKRLSYCEMMEPEQVAKEVMYLHYKLMVGLIPLSTTIHQLVGNSYIFVPTTHIFGNYKQFAEAYDDFIDPEMKAVLNRIEEATLMYSEYEEKAKEILSKHYIYINVGDQQLPSYNDIIDMMKDKLTELNNNPIQMQTPTNQSSSNTKLVRPLIKVSDEECAKIDLL